MKPSLLVAGAAALCVSLSSVATEQGQGFQPEKLRRALDDAAADFWIYEDLDAGYARARKTGKPLLVSFRCVP